ncbi:Hypothetical protein NTJ_00778 [Nesidiocoris tenuis]|uniref:Uncharacterized protein n=1 Tax=Nesidiocoris tenuis TaxID=355587 RepID=A0ABN7A6U1_9HEMI|nr:Hypothetical protein NTJ_00778 [Nesidiocoris tenuis]
MPAPVHSQLLTSASNSRAKMGGYELLTLPDANATGSPSRALRCAHPTWPGNPLSKSNCHRPRTSRRCKCNQSPGPLLFRYIVIWMMNPRSVLGAGLIF